MTEQAGFSAAAVSARRAALAARYQPLRDADEALTRVLADAHARSVAALHRLDEIEAEIEAVVDRQSELALDTPAGALELHRFLCAKQREIVTLVSGAAAEDTAKTAALEALSEHYAPSTG